MQAQACALGMSIPASHTRLIAFMRVPLLGIRRVMGGNDILCEQSTNSCFILILSCVIVSSASDSTACNIWLRKREKWTAESKIFPLMQCVLN